MTEKDLGLWAALIRTKLEKLGPPPDNKSLHQITEEAIRAELEELVTQTREATLREDIHAVGQSPEDCIRDAAVVKGWGEVTGIKELEGDGETKYTWGRRFYADGTSMKAAGWQVAGGYVMTWWK